MRVLEVEEENKRGLREMEGRNPKRAQGTRGVGADHPWCSRPSLENPGTPCAANFACS